MPQLQLSPKAQEIVGQIGDLALRERVERGVRLSLLALVELQRIHLPQDDADRAHAGPQAQHPELAPYVLAAVAAINQLVTALLHDFPSPPHASAGKSDADFDLQFDLVDGPTGEGAGLMAPSDARAGLAADASGRASEAAHVLGGLLRSRVLQFGERLAFALQQPDPWPLLAELDEYKHRLNKAVQGTLFGLLGVFAGDARREEILPAYRSAVREAVQLRQAVAELSEHTSRCNAALARIEGAPAAIPLLVALADWLGRFCARPAYRTLRAEDKRAVIEFRRRLHELRHSAALDLGSLRHEVEGFAKFLETMQAINYREVLVVHDRQRLGEVLALLAQAADGPTEAAGGRLQAAVGALEALQGRSPELDAARREFGPVAASELPAALLKWQASVHAVLGRL